MIIRVATQQDRAGLSACFMELQAYERELYHDRELPEVVADPYIDQLFERCAVHSGTIFVAEDEGVIAGFCCVLVRIVSDDIIEQQRHHAYITDVVVLERHRGRGFGEELLLAAEQCAREGGATMIRVGVLAANVPAARLYEKLGYGPVEIILEKRFQ
jgi:ribosomal protein S18 acetylase RimI-like enzyme